MQLEKTKLFHMLMCLLLLLVYTHTSASCSCFIAFISVFLLVLQYYKQLQTYNCLNFWYTRIKVKFACSDLCLGLVYIISMGLRLPLESCVGKIWEFGHMSLMVYLWGWFYHMNMFVASFTIYRWNLIHIGGKYSLDQLAKGLIFSIFYPLMKQIMFTYFTTCLLYNLSFGQYSECFVW